MGDQLPHPVKVERMERLVEAVQRRAAERAQRFVGRTMDVLVEGTSRTDETRLRGRTRHNKAVNFDGVAEPGEFVEVEIDGGHLADAERGHRRSPSRRFFDGPRDIRADRGRQDRGGDRACRAAAGARRGSGGDQLRRAAGLRGPGGPDRGRERRGAGAAGAPAARVRAGDQRLLGRRLHAAGPRGGRRGAGGGADADRGRGDRALPAGGAGRALAGQGRRRNRRTRSCGRPRPATRRRSSGSTWTGPSSTSGSTPGPRRSSPPAPPRRRAAPTRSAPAARARKALGFDELLAGDVEAMKKRSRNYARRQLTWMRKIPNLHRDRPHRAAATPRSPPDRRQALGRNRLPTVKFEKWQALGNDYLILEQAEPPLGAERETGRVALRPAFRGRRPTASCCSRAAMTPSSSPSCGSSTPTAPRPSSPATARARRSSTCAATAGPTRTRSRSRPSPGRSCRRSPAS